jgi:hypothetical protein
MNAKKFGVAELRAGNLEGYGRTYIRHINEVNSFVKNVSGVKSALKTSDMTAAEDMLRASVVLSDLTTLTIEGGTALKITIPQEPGKIVQLSAAEIEKYKIDPAKTEFCVGIVQPAEKQHIAFYKQCLPLIKRGRLFIRPKRVALIRMGENHWEGLDVEPDADDNTWIVSGESQSLGELPIKVETDGSVPFDLAIPYLRGIPFSDLVLILDDAADTILNLRRGIQKALTQYPKSEPNTIVEFRRDVIDPELETLESSFKKVAASHKYSIGGAIVGSVGLALSAIMTGGATGLITGLLGAGGVGLIGKEYSAYRTKLEEMKENPFYLFWRAKRFR